MRTLWEPVGELAAHLVCSPGAPTLPEPNWWSVTRPIGLRSHPRVRTSVTFGGTAVPKWFDDVLGIIL